MKADREIIFPGSDEAVQCRVYERSELPTGASIDGPCVIEDHESTTVVPDKGYLTVDEQRMLVIDISGVLS